ncbi:hypothetical protein [Mangrovicoccus ximenensis]|uniref:hypothetical protein n=1 Tax=Mangrovicoccus ximenensis TaxID=1911570 RepID=UPI000D3C08F6|nr:hypothetical protein [Mangrovicoccus ximenensis]
MIFREALGDANVLSMAERRTRFAVLIRNSDRKPGPVADTIIDALAPGGPAVGHLGRQVRLRRLAGARHRHGHRAR